MTPRPQFVSDGREEVCTAEIQPPGSRIAFPRSSLFMSEEEEDTFWRSRVPRLEEIQIGQQSSPAVVEISGRIERDPSVLDKILNPPFRYQFVLALHLGFTCDRMDHFDSAVIDCGERK